MPEQKEADPPPPCTAQKEPLPTVLTDGASKEFLSGENVSAVGELPCENDASGTEGVASQDHLKMVQDGAGAAFRKAALVERWLITSTSKARAAVESSAAVEYTAMAVESTVAQVHENVQTGLDTVTRTVSTALQVLFEEEVDDETRTAEYLAMQGFVCRGTQQAFVAWSLCEVSEIVCKLCGVLCAVGVLPLLVLSPSLGALIAISEGWSFEEGAAFALTELTGANTGPRDLSGQTLHPTTDLTLTLDVLCGVLRLAWWGLLAAITFCFGEVLSKRTRCLLAYGAHRAKLAPQPPPNLQVAQ